MTRVAFLLLLAACAVYASAVSGYLVGYVVDYVNGSSETRVFLQLENGTLIPVAGKVPWELIGRGVKVQATIEGNLAYVEAGQQYTIPQSPVSGPLLVTLVAAKFPDVTNEPYNYSYIHDVVFGPFPSMRHFWEYISGGAISIRPYYIQWGWITLPKNSSQYCSGSAFYDIAQDVIYALYSRGITLKSYTYLIIVLNAQPPCYRGAAGMGTIRFGLFQTPYGNIWLAVSQIYHYANWLSQQPDVAVFAHEFGHNLGLHHSGTLDSEYENYWDVMGAYRITRYINSWLGSTFYGLPSGLVIPQRYYLGWALLANSTYVTLVPGIQGLSIQGASSNYVVEYMCNGDYEKFLDWCGVIVHQVYYYTLGRWVNFYRIYNFTLSESNFLDVGQSAWVGGIARISVLWRNSQFAKVVRGDVTLLDIKISRPNATIVVGANAAVIDTIAAVYAMKAFSPTSTYTYPGRALLNPTFVYLDAERPLSQIRYDFKNNQYVAVYLPYPGVVVSVGGPLANMYTRALNPPDRVGVDGLPFYYDTSAGGIRDARTGAVWKSNAAVIAVVVNGTRVNVLIWGLTGEDTRRAALWLYRCNPPPAYGVVINTTNDRVLASWPSGFEGAVSCSNATYIAAAVVGADASSIDAASAVAAVAGLQGVAMGITDRDAFNAILPPIVISAGGPLANKFTGRYNPVNRVGYNGLPFYYDTTQGAIVDGRNGQALCNNRCFVVAKLNDGTRAVILAWGVDGDDTRAASHYLYYNQWIYGIKANVAYVVKWNYYNLNGYRYGVGYNLVSYWVSP